MPPFPSPRNGRVSFASMETPVLAHHCSACGYDLRGQMQLAAGAPLLTCPECGKPCDPLKPEAAIGRHQAALRTFWRRLRWWPAGCFAVGFLPICGAVLAALVVGPLALAFAFMVAEHQMRLRWLVEGERMPKHQLILRAIGYALLLVAISAAACAASTALVCWSWFSVPV